jgi:hypothetical protein
MPRLRFRDATSIAVVLTLAFTHTGRTQSSRGWVNAYATSPPPAASSERSHKIYALDEMGVDPGFGEWIAQTISEVIATGTWKGPGVIRYYAPKNILVVCHTPAVQAKVEEFLKDMRKSLPEAKTANAASRKIAPPDREVVPAAYRAPASLKASRPTVEPSLSYPIPAQAKAPKHLFHFIVRYEGEGIIDDSVVKVMKSYFQAEKKASAAATPVTAYGAAPAAPVAGSPAPVCLPAAPPADYVTPYPSPEPRATALPPTSAAPVTAAPEKGKKRR